MSRGYPPTWQVIELQDLVNGEHPITYGIVQAGPHIEDGVPYIRVSDMSNGELSTKGMQRTSREVAARYQRSTVRTGDLVFALRGDAGRVLQVPEELDGANLTQGTARISPGPLVDANYLLWAIRSTEVQRDVFRRLKGSTFVEISLYDLRKVKVPLPPLPEQRKIAEILSTWDEAIALTEQLIDALERRKKGLMQRLLTGQVRFPEFGKPCPSADQLPEDWTEEPLHGVFKRIRRQVPDDVENVLSITAGIGFEDQREKFGRVIAGKNLSRYVLLRKGEFAYNKGNSLTYPQGCVYMLEDLEQGAVPNVYYSFTAKSPKVVSRFYKYYFENGTLNRQLQRRINTGVRNDGLLNLSADDFFSVTVKIPPLEEQQRVANFLELADEEIELTRQRLEALKQQKKGLMQRLLTGQVRVRV